MIFRRHDSELVPSKWPPRRIAKIVVVLGIVGAVFYVFNTIFALLILLVLLQSLGRLNVMEGKLVVGGLFSGCDHTFAPKPGLAVPQCTQCGAYPD